MVSLFCILTYGLLDKWVRRDLRYTYHVICPWSQTKGASYKVIKQSWNNSVPWSLEQGHDWINSVLTSVIFSCLLISYTIYPSLNFKPIVNSHNFCECSIFVWFQLLKYSPMSTVCQCLVSDVLQLIVWLQELWTS